MAWELAAYAIMIAVLAAAGVFIAAVLRLDRTLRRWDRTVNRLAGKADSVFDAYVILANEARETAEACRQAIGGFSRLADGARAIGEAAESAAQAAASAAWYWRERIASLLPRETDEDAEWGPAYWADLLRAVGRRLRAAAVFSDSRDRPGSSADS